MHVSVIYIVYQFMPGGGMSIVMSSVILWLEPSSMFFVICVSKVFVECFGLKPLLGGLSVPATGKFFRLQMMWCVCL